MSTSSLEEHVAMLAVRRDWEQVRTVLTAVDGAHLLDARLFEVLAEACWWLGRVNECIAARRRALDDHEHAGDRSNTARVALLLSEDHRRQGNAVIAESWRRRAARVLDTAPECAAHGYLRLYQGEAARRRGDLERADVLLNEARAIADRVGSADLAADVTQEIGRVMISGGAVEEGLAVMDDAVLAASDGNLSSYTTGKIYCCMISACDELGDVERVAQWERTSTAWSSTDGFNVFPGMCRVHHADLLAHFGHWSEAESEAERACEELREIGWVVGSAYNTIGHIRLHRGDLDGAARAFREADEQAVGAAGREAGVAGLLLAKGNAQGALARVSRALTATTLPLMRARLLPVQVDSAVACGALDTAASAVDELDQIAAAFRSLKLRATASLARSRLCLARHEWTQACAAVTTALQQWQDLHAPYEVAVARVIQAQTCQALDDHDGWATSLDSAAQIFRSLGAHPDLATIERLRQPSDRDAAATRSPLTAREVDVLRLVATGATNKTIAAQLIVSEKTVARHLSNIFTKLDLSTRAAATAWAFQHNVIPGQPQPFPPTEHAG